MQPLILQGRIWSLNIIMNKIPAKIITMTQNFRHYIPYYSTFFPNVQNNPQDF